MDISKLNILVTGCNGQLGKCVRELFKVINTNKLILTDINVENELNNPQLRLCKLDITKYEDVEKLVKEENVNVIINCAAYTNVDKAEDEANLAYILNAVAVKNLAEASKENNAKLIHISTDYVFDGKSYMPYNENKIVNPIGIYGATKESGERIALEILKDDCIIIRTAWLYSNYGNNFVRTMVNLGKTKNEIKVIFDQIGTPTSAHDLANAIICILKSDKWVGGIFHYSNEGVCSWYDFAWEIMNTFGLTCKVIPIHTSEYPTKAERPHYSVLDKTKIKEIYGIHIPYWKESLAMCAIRYKELKASIEFGKIKPEDTEYWQ